MTVSPDRELAQLREEVDYLKSCLTGLQNVLKASSLGHSMKHSARFLVEIDIITSQAEDFLLRGTHPSFVNTEPVDL